MPTSCGRSKDGKKSLRAVLAEGTDIWSSGEQREGRVAGRPVMGAGQGRESGTR